ncbi:MAG: transposase, partial [Minisyncoccia bacterium]
LIKALSHASKDFRKLLGLYSFTQSMSSKGKCYDNAPMESFFKTMKVECLYRKQGGWKWKESSNAIFDYVYTFYNTVRLHSSLNYKSPSQYLKEFKERQENEKREIAEK